MGSVQASIPALKTQRIISHAERVLLFELFRKQRLGAGASMTANNLPMQILLSKLMVVSVAYCWNEFDEEDWGYVSTHLRSWIQSAVVMMEEIAENVNDAITNNFKTDSLDAICKSLNQIVFISNPFPIIVAKNALLSFSLLVESFGVNQGENVENINSLMKEKCDPIKGRILDGVLRLFFCTGLAEAIACSCCHEAAAIISSSRFEHLLFWELVGSCVINSSTTARDRAVKSVEFWGLSKGPISSLYAILFSSKPVNSLQFAAYVILSTEPVSHIAVVQEENVYIDGNTNSEEDSRPLDLSTETNIHLNEEVSSMIEKLPYEVLDMDLVSEQRVSMFLFATIYASVPLLVSILI